MYFMSLFYFLLRVKLSPPICCFPSLSSANRTVGRAGHVSADKCSRLCTLCAYTRLNLYVKFVRKPTFTQANTLYKHKV